MDGKCPECNSELIELRHEKPTEKDYSTGTHDLYQADFYLAFYGYWCQFCEKMYEPRTKTWLEPWKYQSSNQTAIKEGG